MPHYFNILGSGVQILVPTEQLEQARKIVKIDSHRLLCPHCGSSNVMNSNERIKNKLELALIALFLVLPIGNLLNNYICKSCQHQFKKVDA